MKIETLYEAKRIENELLRWQDIDTRLSCGDGFYRIMFVAPETKTLPNKYEILIRNEETINSYKKFVSSMIKQLEKEIEQL